MLAKRLTVVTETDTDQGREIKKMSRPTSNDRKTPKSGNLQEEQMLSLENLSTLGSLARGGDRQDESGPHCWRHPSESVRYYCMDC